MESVTSKGKEPGFAAAYASGSLSSTEDPGGQHPTWRTCPSLSKEMVPVYPERHWEELALSGWGVAHTLCLLALSYLTAFSSPDSSALPMSHS